ncbi:MAG: protein kinase domain-containing protein, partial [Bryobacteraceae bacterium]
ANPSRRPRFEQEARAAGALNHPNIVAVYDVGSQDGVSFLVTELVEGETLREVIQRGPVAPRKVVDLAAQMASGLAAAHLAGIVHRDLKPENVMIASGGRVKILDFGLAKQVAFAGPAPSDATRTQTDAGTVLGTVGYMAPEQVRGTAVDHRADLFSLGVILYEMLTGHRAFARDTSVETMHAILNEEPRELPDNTPPDLARIVMHCLEKDPRQRFQSAQDLAFALQSVSGSASSIPKAVAATVPANKPRALLVAAAVACAALLVLGGFLLRARLGRAAQPFFRQVTFRHGMIQGARFSPDGHSVVYSAAWDMRALRAYLQGIGNAEAHDLDFPDGTDVASVSRRGDLALLRRFGGFTTSRVLARSSLAGESPRDLLDDVSFVDWAPDGSSLAVVRRIGGKMRLEYPIGTPLYESVFVLAPRVSPDGSQVAFFRTQDLNWFVTVVDRSGKVRDLTTVAKAASIYDASLAWTPNGREVWFSGSDPAESGQIRAVDLSGNSRVITRLPGHAAIGDISRDGRVLINTENERAGILYGEGDSMPRDLSWLDASYLNDLSEDGKTVLLTETGQASGPAKSVYLRNTDGSPAIRLSSGFGGNLSQDG